MPHQETYLHNEAYAEFLANWDANFYAKYADYLAAAPTGSRVLDVGCGAGQVVGRLTNSGGHDAYGVDVSEPNIARAHQVSSKCQRYDGRHLPFPDGHFSAVGALNVIEHVEEPEQLIPELVRVTAPNGRVILSSPNFFRVIGFRDYHPKMRGVANKLANLRRILQKRSLIRSQAEGVRFDRMTPIVKEPFTPDDDAIIATNAVEISFFLRKSGCVIEKILCTDRYVSKPLDFLLNATPLRYLMFNAFVVSRKTNS